MRRSSKAKWLGGGAVVALGVVLLADNFHGSVAAPRPEALVTRIVEANAPTSSYRAQFAVGQVGGPRSAIEHYFSATKQVFAIQDTFGFRHAELWTPGAWEWFQGGANYQARIATPSRQKVPYGQWRLSKFPTLPELAQAVKASTQRAIRSSEDRGGQKVWLMDCRVPLPPGAEKESSESFYQSWFGRPWRLWVTEQGEITRVSVSPDSSAPAQIGISNLVRPAPPLEVDWRSLVGEVKVTRRSSFFCDAASEKDVEKVRAQILKVVDGWRSKYYQKYEDPPVPAELGR